MARVLLAFAADFGQFTPRTTVEFARPAAARGQQALRGAVGAGSAVADPPPGRDAAPDRSQRLGEDDLAPRSGHRRPALLGAVQVLGPDAGREPDTVRSQVGLLGPRPLRLRGPLGAREHDLPGPTPRPAPLRRGRSPRAPRTVPRRRPAGAPPLRRDAAAAGPGASLPQATGRGAPRRTLRRAGPGGYRGARGPRPGAARRRDHARPRHASHRTRTSALRGPIASEQGHPSPA